VVTGLSALGFEALSKSEWCSEQISKIFGHDYRQILDEAKRTEFRVTVTSTLHALIVSGLGAWVFFAPEKHIWESENARVPALFGESPRAMLAFGIATGYFMWDMKLCFSEKKLNLGFALHACLCFLVYLFGQFPFLNYYGSFFLLFESSTVFLNLRKMLLAMGKTGHALLPIVSQLFAVVFFLVRIVGGFLVSAGFWRAVVRLLQDGNAHSQLICYFYLASNLALNGLNLLWFLQIIRSVLKRRP